MEAKDTVMKKIPANIVGIDNLLEAQAEISYKAGYEQRSNELMAPSTDSA